MVYPSKMWAAQMHAPNTALKYEEISVPVLGAGEVLVKMKASPINPSDLAYLTGTYAKIDTYPKSPGLEGAGVVLATGKGILAKRLLGKNVVCSPTNKGGTWAEYMVTDAMKCLPFSKKIDFDAAATMVVNPLTALAMSTYAKRNKHQTVILTAAGGALGKMLIQLLKNEQIKTICIVRKEDKMNELKALGAEVVLNSAQVDFDDTLRASADRWGASLALDAVSGSVTAPVLSALVDGGELLVYGTLSGEKACFDPKELVRKHKTISHFHLSQHLAKQSPIATMRQFGKVKRMISNEMRTSVNKTFGLEQVNEAIALYENNMSQGKVLFVMNRS